MRKKFVEWAADVEHVPFEETAAGKALSQIAGQMICMWMHVERGENHEYMRAEQYGLMEKYQVLDREYRRYVEWCDVCGSIPENRGSIMDTLYERQGVGVAYAWNKYWLWSI